MYRIYVLYYIYDVCNYKDNKEQKLYDHFNRWIGAEKDFDKIQHLW